MHEMKDKTACEYYPHHSTITREQGVKAEKQRARPLFYINNGFLKLMIPGPVAQQQRALLCFNNALLTVTCTLHRYVILRLYV